MMKKFTFVIILLLLAGVIAGRHQRNGYKNLGLCEEKSRERRLKA